MKKTILYMAFAAFSLTALAQQSYKGDITIIPTALQQRGDSLFVNFNIAMQDIKMATRQSAEFTPVLVSASGEKCLPKILINGRNNYKSYKRNQFFAGKSRVATAYPAVYDAYRAKRKDNGTLNYNLVIPFEKWMRDARLDIRKDDCGCGNSNTLEVQQLISNVSLEKIIIIEPYMITPHLAYVQPAIEAEKQRALEGNARLDFAVGKSEIRSDFGNNAAELNKIESMVKAIDKDDAVTIRKITISGYASPEGSLASNKRLSEARALAVKKYLNARCDVPNEKYSISFGGEDWDSLAEMIKASDMTDKSELLNLINSTSIENGRETAIMSYRSGEPYRYMLKNMFPALRRVACKIDYNVRKFNVEEAKQVFETNPQHLSLDEMFRIASTYEKGSEQFNELFETAARLFPQDETANFNAAQIALSRGDITSAERYLSKIKSRVRVAEYDNAMGVLAMLKGDYAKAEEIFKQAEKAGIAAATENLKELDVKRKNIQQIELQKK